MSSASSSGGVKRQRCRNSLQTVSKPKTPQPPQLRTPSVQMRGSAARRSPRPSRSRSRHQILRGQVILQGNRGHSSWASHSDSATGHNTRRRPSPPSPRFQTRYSTAKDDDKEKDQRRRELERMDEKERELANEARERAEAWAPRGSVGSVSNEVLHPPPGLTELGHGSLELAESHG